MPKIHFLSADVPLVKRFEMVDGKVEKHPYPFVKFFTSEAVEAETLRDFHKALVRHADLGHCLIKGKLHVDLVNESRAGSTKSDDTTQWVCLDLDRAPFATPAEFMKAMGLADVTHVVQYSASQGLSQAQRGKGLSCHIFLFLTHPYSAPYLKAWLMHLNLETKELRQALTLTRSHAALHWSLDVTACQNDKLLYIAKPQIGKGVYYKLETPIEYVASKLPALPIERLKCAPIEALKKQAQEIVNAKRLEAGLDKLRSQVKWVGEFEVQAKPGEAQITGIKHERGFTYLNLNGGDSWGYYHPDDNFELIHNFKGEPSYSTKELLPDYYKDCVGKRARINATPTEDGTVVAAICDRRTARYWKLSWNPETFELRLDPARSELQLEHFLNSHGRSLNGDFIPQWDLVFDPHGDWVVDEENNKVNLYVPSPYYREPRRIVTPDDFPNTWELLKHVVGGGSDTSEIFLWMINWVADIVQHRDKTGVALTNSGTYGTGKGLFVQLMHRMLGERYVAFKRNRDLEDRFTAWLEENIFISVDEAQTAATTALKETIHNELKTWITDNPLAIRRMNVDPYQARTYCNFIFSSNRRDPVQVDDKDRRHNFGEYQEKPLNFTPEQIAALRHEVPSFFQYVINYKVDRRYARTIIHNETRKSVVEANMTSVDMVSRAIVNGDLEYLWQSMPDMNVLAELHGADTAYAASFAAILKDQTRDLAQFGSLNMGFRIHESRLSRDQLGVIFNYCVGNMPDSPNKFTRLLKHHDITTEKLRMKDGTTTHGIKVRWLVRKEWLEDIMASLEAPKPQDKIRRIK